MKVGNMEFDDNLTVGEIASEFQRKTAFEEFAQGFKIKIERKAVTAEELVRQLEMEDRE